MPQSSTIDGASEGPARLPTVLIVDDESSIARTLSLILEAHGYRAAIARSGDEAVEQARASAPDVFVCDIVMPGISGIEAAIQIRTLCPECRIMLMSGNTVSTELLDQARARGHEFEVLAKPFHPTRLMEWLQGGAAVTHSGV
ncbi:MAG TPA: response regulator [Terriglobales bacterium]|nr:response regulator [Acidobacteriaceae bacterium]HKR30844.1 response regulator [Terriglobales bacterium]